MKVVTKFESKGGKLCHTAKDALFCDALYDFMERLTWNFRDFDEDDYAQLLSWVEEEREVFQQFLEETS